MYKPDTSYNDEFDWEKYPGLKEEIQKLTRGSTTVLRTELETRQYRNKFQPPLVSVQKFAAVAVGARDQDEIILEVDTAGTYGGPYNWHLRYHAADTSAYKWRPIGSCKPLRAYGVQVGPWSTINNSTYIALTTPASIVPPLSGIYEIRHGCFFQQQSAALSQAQMAAAVNGTPLPGGAQVVQAGSNAFDLSGYEVPNYGVTLLASDTVTIRQSSNNQSYGTGQPYVQVVPTRLGP